MRKESEVVVGGGEERVRGREWVRYERRWYWWLGSSEWWLMVDVGG